MLQRQLRPTARAQKVGGDGPSSAPGNRQSRLGNAEVNNRTAPAPVASETNTFPDGEELQAPEAQQPTRPKSVRSGQKGALIGSNATVTLSKSEDGTGKAAATVPDGVAAEVRKVKGGRIKVAVRDGAKNVEGWVDAAIFSNQPALTRDEEDSALADDYVYSKIDGDHSPESPTGKQTAQGAAGDCFLIASMAAVANAAPGAIRDMVKYDKAKGTYTVRFYEEQGRGKFTPVYIEVDAYLPTAKDNRKDPTYAGDQGGPMWSAIIEKAYAQWKGGYDVIGEGGTGEEAMTAITGARSRDKSPSNMKEAEVIPFFEAAKKDGQAIYAGVRNSLKTEAQTPFGGTGDGPLRAKASHTHRWNEIVPGTVSVTDSQGKADDVWDTGAEGDKSAKLAGGGRGTVGYKGETKDALELTYGKGKGPAKAGDLKLEFEYHGVLDTNKFIIGNHAYAFEGVVGGKELQFYNPWGTYQPKPITPAEFLRHFDSLTTNTPPSQKTQG